jgi:hypothetical protein
MILQVPSMALQERKHCFEMDMLTKENLYLNTSSTSIYTRMCSCVACRQWSAAGNMRESSFSKSAHHD